MTLKLVRVIAREVDNLPINFDVSRLFRSRLIGQHLSDASRDLATLNHPAASPCPELDTQSFQAVDGPEIPVDAPTLEEVHQETKVLPCCRTRCDTTRNAEARSNQPHSSSTVCQCLGYW